MTIDTLGGTLLGVSIIGLANAAIRPVLSLANFRFNFWGLTGLTLLINVAAFLLVIKTLPGIEINNFFSFISLAGFLFITLCSVMLTKLVEDR